MLRRDNPILIIINHVKHFCNSFSFNILNYLDWFLKSLYIIGFFPFPLSILYSICLLFCHQINLLLYKLLSFLIKFSLFIQLFMNGRWRLQVFTFLWNLWFEELLSCFWIIDFFNYSLRLILFFCCSFLRIWVLIKSFMKLLFRFILRTHESTGWWDRGLKRALLF